MNNPKMKLRKFYLYISIKNNKIFKNKLTKEVQDLYTEIYAILLRETKKDLKKWKL